MVASQNPPTIRKAKVIFNPKAGSKRRLLSKARGQTTLEEIKELLAQYQIEADFFPTKRAGHATQLACQAIKEKYNLVLVAGGDGTVGEVANGLIGTDLPLGILPLGSFMNVARMLSIPQDLEKAVELIKIGRIRKIDVGCVTRMNGEVLDRPHYFIESCGLGLEAQLQEHVLRWEKGDLKAIFKMIKTLFDYYGHKVQIILDEKKEIVTRATLVTISNGPYSGAALPLAPAAKLNDHRLTVSLFKMSKFELLRYLVNAIWRGKTWSPKIVTFQARRVKIISKTPRLVHADARVFGITPVTFSVLPNALSVITGFPKPGTSSLVKRTYLDS